MNGDERTDLKSRIDKARRDRELLVPTLRMEHERSLPLTRRGVECLQLVSEGFDNEEIAEQLHLAEETVKDHLKKSFRRLGARNRAHAVAVAMRRGWIA